METTFTSVLSSLELQPNVCANFEVLKCTCMFVATFLIKYIWWLKVKLPRG